MAVDTGIRRKFSFYEDFFEAWHRYRSKPSDISVIEIVDKISLHIYDINRIKRYMNLSLEQAINEMVNELFGNLGGNVTSSLKEALLVMGEELRDKVIRPRVEKQLGDNYEEGYVEALTIALLAVLLGLGGRIESSRFCSGEREGSGRKSVGSRDWS